MGNSVGHGEVADALEGDLTHGPKAAFHRGLPTRLRHIRGVVRPLRVSRKTGYKWLGRYELIGPRGWKTSRAAAHVSHGDAVAVVEQLLALRRSTRAGGRRSC